MADDAYLIPRAPEPETTQPRQHPREHRLARTAVCISLVAALAALSAAFFSYLQWKAANRQAVAAEGARTDAQIAAAEQKADIERARIAAEQSASAAQELANGMERSARAAETSADAGRTALALNRRALVLSQMPFLEIFSARLLKPLKAGESPEIETKIFNSGKGVGVRVKVQQWSGSGPQRVFTYKPAVTEISTLDMAPGVQAGVSVVSKFIGSFNEEQLKTISDGHLFIWVYGLIEYWDETLEKPRRHVRQFCGFYMPTSAEPQMLAICPEHNKTVE